MLTRSIGAVLVITMSQPYSEELLYTQSEDGLILAGLAIRPVELPPHPVSIVWIHGNTGTFYDYPYIVIGRALARRGYIFLSGNTRGHDISATLWRMPEDTPVGGGSAWEQLEEAPRDLAAWVEVGASLVQNGAILVGHSLGAVKVVQYQAERQDPGVVGMILASPDVHGHWPPDSVETAKRLVAEGRGMEVLPAQPYAPWYRLSAQNVVSRANVYARTLVADRGTPTVAMIRCPMLVFFGTRDVGGEAELETIRRNAAGASRIDTHLIREADHAYTGHEEEVVSLIAGWIDSLPDRG
jgi:pimeloyl-ACP methyl ester carboxylesterase